MLGTVIMFLAVVKTSLTSFMEKSTEEDRKQKEENTLTIVFIQYMFIGVCLTHCIGYQGFRGEAESTDLNSVLLHCFVECTISWIILCAANKEE